MRQYVWVLEQVNIINLVRCLFWIAICFLWRDKNICLATIRLYFASLTHAIRIYIVKSLRQEDCCIPFPFSFFFFFSIIIFMQHYFYCLDVNRKLNIMAYKFRSCWEIFYNVLFTINLIPKSLSNLNQPNYTSKYWYIYINWNQLLNFTLIPPKLDEIVFLYDKIYHKQSRKYFKWF